MKKKTEHNPILLSGPMQAKMLLDNNIGSMNQGVQGIYEFVVLFQDNPELMAAALKKGNGKRLREVRRALANLRCNLPIIERIVNEMKTTLEKTR